MGVIHQEGTIRWDDLWAKEDAWRERKLKEKKEKERKKEERKKDGKETEGEREMETDYLDCDGRRCWGQCAILEENRYSFLVGGGLRRCLCGSTPLIDSVLLECCLSNHTRHGTCQQL